MSIFDHSPDEGGVVSGSNLVKPIPMEGTLDVLLRRRRQPSPTTVLVISAFGAFLAFLDSTIVNIAFPAIQRSFGSDLNSVSWVLNAYNIVLAAFLVLAGRVADLLGRKRTFIYGVAWFTIASGLCSAAGSVGQLVTFRILQGIGAAVLIPASLGLVIEGFGIKRRARGVGLWGAAAALASGLGPPIGGALIEVSNWRWVFLVNLPLGLVAIFLARQGLVESRAAGRRRIPDVRGAWLLAAGLGLLTLGLTKGPEWGWTSYDVVGSLVVATIALLGFVRSSRTHPVPLVDPTFLRIQSFVAGNVLTLISAAGFYAYMLTHVLFLNYVWGYSLVKAGLAIAPAAVVAAVVAALLGRLADNHGYRLIVGVGALVWAGSLVWYLTRVGAVPDFYGAWLPGQVLQGIGVGATLPVLGSAALAGLSAGASYATASAVVMSVRQVGAVIGVTLLVILVGTPARGAAEEALHRGWVMATICFMAVAGAAMSLGRVQSRPAEVAEPTWPLDADESRSRPALPPLPTRPVPLHSNDVDMLGALPLFAGLDQVQLEELWERAEHVELEAGSFLFRAGDPSDCLYLLRQGRVQVLDHDSVVAELGRGEVVGELGLLIDAPRSLSVRALRDSTLIRLTRSEFAKFANAGVLGTLVQALALRLHDASRVSKVNRGKSEVVVAVVGANAGARAAMVAYGLCAALSGWLHAISPGRVDRDGLERAELAADRVVLHATSDDGEWLEFCLRVADRIVLVANDPAPPAKLAPRFAGADLVLAGRPASREHRRAWEMSVAPRSVHVIGSDGAAADLRALAMQIAGRSVGLVLGGGGARAFAHLGVLEELESAGVVVDRFAGTSTGAMIAALAASGIDAAGVDALVYEYFVRSNPLGDYTVPTKGLIRGQRILTTLRTAFGGTLVEELPKQFRCVSVDLLARERVVHRSGPLAEVIACSLRLPGLYPPFVYGDGLHVDGGVLDNLPVETLSGGEGPVVAVNICSGSGSGLTGGAGAGEVHHVPDLADTLMRTMSISSEMALSTKLAKADVVVHADPSEVGFLEFHQIDRAREAGRLATRAVLPQIMGMVYR